jgi:Protein of unknown function (DUF3467)
MSEPKATVNFTIVPDETSSVTRVYSNFCAIQHSPFDFTLTFCDVLPLGERQMREAQANQAVKAPIRARIAFPVQMLPGLIAALQENFRIYQETYGPPAGPLH